MIKIAFACTKGGVGKSTFAINISSYLANKNKKCLLIDCDAQGNIQNCFNIRSDKYLSDLLLTGTFDIIKVRPNIDIINSGKKLLAEAETAVSGKPYREEILSKNLKNLNSYDYVFCDLSPTITLVNSMALHYVDYIITPISMSYYAISGAVQMLDIVKTINEHSPVELFGIGLNMYDSRTVISQMIVNAVREQWGDKVFKTVVRKNVAIEEAHSQHLTIFEHAPNSHGAEDFENLSKEILEHGN